VAWQCVHVPSWRICAG